MKNSDIKIIFVDIDETLLYHHKNRHDFDKKSFRALKKAQKDGVKVVIATARPYHSAFDTGVFNYIKPDAIVTCNGTVAIVDEKVIYSDSFKQSILKKTIDVCDSMGFVIEVATPFGRYFTNKPNEYVEEYFKVYFETVPEIKKDFSNEDVNALLIFSPVEYDKELFEKIGDGMFGYRFTKCGIDMHTHDVGKADGMKEVLKYFNVSTENALAIGDSIGDICMFKLCKYSAAMGNANDKAKAEATFITKHIAKHGVKYALKKYNVI